MMSISYNRQFTNPEKYHNLVTYQEFKSIQNDEGHWVDNWVDSDLGTTWAQIRTIRGKEFIEAGAQQAEVSARINARYRGDVVKKYYEKEGKIRIKYGKRIFEIVYMNNLEEKNVELEFIVDEVV